MSKLINRREIDYILAPIAPVLKGEKVHYEYVAFRKQIEEIPTVPAVLIPENVTNGEIIQALFPDLVDEIGFFRSHLELTTDRHEFYFNDVTSEESRMAVDEKWWDEPYERKDTE